MSDPIPLQIPAGFAPAFALGIDDGQGNLELVAQGSPLPVYQAAPAAPAALDGQTTSNVIVGPFAPTVATPVFLTLAGDWEGTVTLKRSTDGGATLHPLTAAGSAWGIYRANACEPVWEEGEEDATLWLDCAVNSGTLAYRLAQ
ncbi:hypothetical protein [Qipengyuania vesicularis]|uniref:hypothetical protein n=1 Tax=Qipengyuania vesicularis TaxID=2867232 RepID=UPI001C86BDAB|nr:hypothetical protein [Qipengyuania vesicularis]MBX7528000.1 hypothetical protein [Qipengyuania vesicularis]